MLSVLVCLLVSVLLIEPVLVLSDVWSFLLRPGMGAGGLAVRLLSGPCTTGPAAGAVGEGTP